jgi:hypothetical protein
MVSIGSVLCDSKGNKLGYVVREIRIEQARVSRFGLAEKDSD